MSYDRALTRFSPDGRLFQTEYALAAVNSGSTVVAIRTPTIIVVAVEKQDIMKLQSEENSRKLCLLDDHILCAYAGLHADARVLLHHAMVECQSHRLTFEDPISVERISKYIATIQLQYTQRGGVRPFGIATLVCGFDSLMQPHIYETLPSGAFSEWKAKGIGRFGHPVQEYLEKFHSENMSEDDALRIAIGSLREIADCRPKNMEVVVMKPGENTVFLPEADISSIVTRIDSR